MKLLLDTNALIWLLGQPKNSQLGQQAKQTIQAADVVYASAVSILEIRIKAMLGKLQAPTDLLTPITAAGLKTLPLEMDQADAISRFPALTRHDPFDRMLLAQATAADLSLLTSDAVLLGLTLPQVLDAKA